MKRYTLLTSTLCLLLGLVCHVTLANNENTNIDAFPGDGTLRSYRLAIPITQSAYVEDFGSNYDNVLAFWQSCEDFVNAMFIPLGFCFDVVVDDRLVMKAPNLIEESIYNATSYGTELLDGAIGSAAYDVGMWVTYRELGAENTGLSINGGAYTARTKGSGYAMADAWVVAHELGHMFGAPHTTTGEGSLMDTGGEYFSYPSIKIIRDRAKGTSSYNNLSVANSAPRFDATKMQVTYRIPQGACLSIDVQATDLEGHRLMYTAIGCSSTTVGDVEEGCDFMPYFASLAPQESNVITYAPVYTADINYPQDFYLKEGTDIPNMKPGTYPLTILVNDMSEKDACNYNALQEKPFYSTYALWETGVEIVPGTAFSTWVASAKPTYTAGEEMTVCWGVNESYFAADSRLRITLSADYGRTFPHVLAASVSALDGKCTVSLPNINIGTVDVDFTAAVRTMSGGIIKVEEIGGAAFTLTSLSPMDGQSFTVTGATGDTPTGVGESAVSGGQPIAIYDFFGRKVTAMEKDRVYIVDGKRVVR